MASDLPAAVEGIAALADRYDGFVLDLWGVLHDGVRAYPGAADALARLRDAGRRVVLLSNSPGRRASVAAKMERMGIGPCLYDGLVTSGEETFLALRDRPDAFHAGLGRRIHHIGPAPDAHVFEGLEGYAFADAPADADLAVVTGADADATIDDFREVLAACLAAGLPMVCANPDLTVVHGGRDWLCAGAVAARYAEMGGRVAWHGKPHPPVYRRCLDLLGGMAPGNVLAAGDSLRTDVAGAAGAGIDCLFVTQGIHRDELGVRDGGTAAPERIAALLERHPHRPRWTAPSFVW